ncbi:hypothetical protein [Phycicoccus sp. SLBN-51]|uniref:hypothetical protein n=1 Tax=Phycicoccus sp. SLBN-51 TaxID=2768447 RepID=UPI0011544242|nr:hypothetical protein [Phycicoccus sp. SLBN-51]TQJ49276.1 hypothetical protein FBY26_0954 [Phycicoccus sp. SLBN-51]
MPHNRTPITANRTPLHATALAGFRSNPHLAVDKLVAAMNRNAGVEPTVHPDLAGALDRAAVEQFVAGAGSRRTTQTTAPRPQPLHGTVLITRNRTSAPSNRTLCFAPTAADLAALLAGEHLAHDLLASQTPTTLAAQNDAIAHYIAPIVTAYQVRSLERRGVQVAEAAARHYLNHGQPAGLAFVRSGHLRRWWAEQLTATDPHDQLDTAHAAAEAEAEGHDAAARLLHRPRLAWTHPAGLEHGLLLDRFHHTHQRGALERDTWIHGKVAQDLTSIDALLRHAGPRSDAPAPEVANLGVRVHAHRAPNVGVHFLPDYTSGRPRRGNHHRIGGCQHCTTRVALPNTQPTTQPTTQSHPWATSATGAAVAAPAGAGVRS